jgi:hypothetical protein
LGAEDVLGNICGFLTVIIAIFMLNAFRDVDVSLSDVRGILRPKAQNTGGYRNQSNKYNPLPVDEEGLMSQDEQVVYSSTGTTTHIR